jgi:hypothetical protein
MALWFYGLSMVLILCAGLCAGALSAPPTPAGPVVLRAADFGARPDDGKDDNPAVQAMLAAARKANAPVLIRFAPGRYDFFANTASKAHYPVTAVHLQWDLVTPFHLDGMKHLTIDGRGATFMMHGRMTPFVLNACEDVAVRNARVEHVRPSVFELKVAAKGEGWIDYQSAAGDRYVIEGNHIVWLDADDKPQRPNCFVEYDPLLDTARRCPDPLAGALAIRDAGDGRLRAEYPPGSKVHEKIRPGHTFQFRLGTRSQSGAVIFECRDVAFEDMDICSWNGLGFVGQFCRNVTLRNLRMGPSAESGRTNAGFADAVQMMNCRGRILIEGCRIVGLHDDHINIYGQLMKIEAVEGPRTFRAIYTSGETQGHMNFRPGDVIGFRDPATLADAGQGKVVKAELLGSKTMRIEFDGGLPDKAEGFWAENRTWIPDEVVIRGNYFGRVPTRSILMYLAREAIIENNVFHRIPMSAILTECPDGRYALQNFLGSLTIRNNVFYECQSALVRCSPQAGDLSPQTNMYGTLHISDNLIVRREGGLTLMDVRGFDKVRVGENRAEIAAGGGGIEARLRDCKEAQLLGQRILGAAGAAKVRCQAVSKLSAGGWETIRD